MTFIAEAQIEARAAELWRQQSLESGFDVERLLDDLELDLCWELLDDDDGNGSILGQLIPAQRLVVLNERHKNRLEKDGGRQLRFTIGHEIGHWILHSEGLGDGAKPLIADERTMCRGGSRESIEIQAEMFSAALLMQRDALETALPKGEWRGWGPVYELATAFSVTPTAMKNRLRGLGWIHLDEDETPVGGPAPAPGQESLLG
jgi:IrrE N-terminal-like domain